MKISYDPEVDALSITFREATVTTKHLAEGIAADYDAAGRLAGIEVLDAIRRFGDRETLRHVVLEGVGAPAAAVHEPPGKEYGKKPQMRITRFWKEENRTIILLTVKDLLEENYARKLVQALKRTNKSVVFVCTANVCRSVMAHAILEAEAARRSLPIKVDSAGVADFTDTCPADAAWITCLQHGTPISKFGATFVRDLDLSCTVRIFIMESAHRQVLGSLRPDISAPVTLLSQFDPKQRGTTIEDPMNQRMPAFERCYARLRDCITHYLDVTTDFNDRSVIAAGG